MAYNLYQVQMARAWQERIEKENAQAEAFWAKQAMAGTQQLAGKQGGDAASVAGSHVSSAAPTGYTSKTSYLKSRLEQLESQLATEREYRKKVEQDLEGLRTGLQQSMGGGHGSKPGTPKYQ